MYSIDKITIREYFSLKDTGKYDIFINVLNPLNSFAGKKCYLEKLTFDQVEVIKSILNNPNLEDFKDMFLMVFNIKGDMSRSAEEVFYDADLFDMYRANKYIQEHIQRISEKEIQWLSGKEDDKLLMINASNRIAPFSHLLTKIRLAEQFATTPSVIGTWRYERVFNICVALKVNADLQKEYAEIK